MKNERNAEGVTLSKEQIEDLWNQYDKINQKMAAIDSKYKEAA